MTPNTTPAKRPRPANTRGSAAHQPRSVLWWVVMVSVVIHVVGFYGLWSAGLLNTQMTFNQQEAEKRAADVAERERLRKEQERAQREKIELPEQMRENLKEEVQRKQRRRIEERVKEMLRDRDEVREVRDRKLDDLKKRDPAQMQNRQMEAIQQEVREMRAANDELDETVQETVPRGDPRVTEMKETSDAIEAKTDELAEATADKAASPQDAAAMKDLAKSLADHSRESRKVHDTLEPRGLTRRQALDVVNHARDAAAKAEELADLMARNDLNEISGAHELAEVDESALAEKSTAELYDLAREMEQDVNETYVDVRAAELAMNEDSSFAEAKEKIARNGTERPDLAEQLANPNLDDVGQLSEYREVIAEADRQTQQMSLRADSLSRQAQSLDHGASGNEQGNRMARAMMQASRDTRSADVSGLMRAMTGGDNGTMSDTNLTNLEEGGEGMSATDRHQPAIRLDQQRVVAQALPGRKFDKDSPRQGWLYIDTWYVIGPFENNGKVDWTRTNPPDTEIDFDATYEGKNRLTVNWEFTQADQIMLIPPQEKSNSTYYAYTEVYFDEPQEMMVAIATDDASQVKINDLQIWEEAGLSGWRLGEGTRRVFFKQGYNTIKLRIENGPNVCRWTFLMCPPGAK